MSACSSGDQQSNPLWSPASYVYDAADKHADLSLHYLDGVEDILQADVMIQRKDGSGPVFEVQNAAVEIADDGLSFKWTDGFENQGSAIIRPVKNNPDSVHLRLKVEHVSNDRDLMFIDDYELKKQLPDTTGSTE